MAVRRLIKMKLIDPPKHLSESIQYEIMSGSVSYGISTKDSDIDIVGFSIPSREIIFPHTVGYIAGFDTEYEKFEQYQNNHVLDKTDNKEYDITIYSIIKYFKLCMQNNPNMIDSLFVPRRCVLYMTEIGKLVRGNRKLFLHKGSWHRFKGYAYRQIYKMKNKMPLKGSKRWKLVQMYGYDIQFATHTVRLLNEIEQILIKGDLDLEENREQLKSIKRGEWTEKQILDYFNTKETALEELYLNSSLPYGPPEEKIKTLLINCLEMHFGSLQYVIQKPSNVDSFINDLNNLINSYTGRK